MSKKPVSSVQAFLVLGVLLALLVICISLMSGGPRKPSLDSLKSDAVVYCQMAVKDSLKSPKSAEFPWNMTALELKNNRFAVMSYVDAQNSFGALIRMKFTCEVEHVGEDKWRLKDLMTSED